jgi:serine/threonine protein kinase
MYERDLFMAALQIEDAAERAAYLDRACAGETALRQRVEALLAAFDRAGSFLQQPAGGPGETSNATRPGSPGGGEPTEGSGRVIGSYKLLEQIGEGGMGTVWMAQQTEPVRRLVAVKLIKAGMDSRQVIARFEAERQALAVMDHPNIARVLDGGTTEDGRPYFVMDLVTGVPITRYCDEHRLTPRQRLELFLPVCQAVQHAHQKGIIHRDLKPSNVLVALYDGRPVPKVIDFGVAKAAGQPLTEKTLVTGFGNIVGTLEYMSPEQAEINQLDIDTRSDVYSLGVLLYELLTGSPPFTRRELEKAGVLEMLRVIREQEPSKPSTKLSSAEGLPTLAANRGTEPAKLTRLVRGELDWVVMKAMEKDRNRRYETANGFALDVQRYLADEPVQAGPPSAGYRFRKFARRNRVALAAATVVALTVLLAVAGLAALALLLRQERDRAEANAEDARGRQREAEQARRRTREALNALTDGVIANLFARQPRLGPEEKQFLREVLEHYEEIAAEQGDTEPARASRADGYCRVANLRTYLGELAEAERSYETGLALYSRLAADFPAQPNYVLAQAGRRGELATLLRRMGRPRKAEAAHRAVLDLLAGLPPAIAARPEPRRLSGQAHSNWGILLYKLGRLEEAKAAWRSALALQTELAREFPAEAEYRIALSNTHNNIGNELLWSGRSREAEKAFRTALDLRARLVKDFPASAEFRMALAMTQNNLGVALDDLHRTEEALEALRKARSLRADLAKDFPTIPDFRHDLAESHKNVALMLQRAGKQSESLAAFRDALAIQERLADDFRTVPDYRQYLATIYNDLGALHRGAGRLREAEEAHRAAQHIRAELVKEFDTNPDHANDLAGTLVNLANVARDRKDRAAARALLEQALPYHHAALKANPKNPVYRRFYRNNTVELTAALVELGEHAAAVRKAEELAGLDVVPVDDTYNAACYVAGCIPVLGKDAGLDEARRKALAADYASRSMALLRRAVAKGYGDAAHMKRDSDLDPLRGREDFKALLANLETAAKPAPAGGP